MGILDFILTPIYIFIIFFLSRFLVKNNIEKKPYYKYYLTGLTIKIIGGFGVCIIYLYYYGSGDTLLYFHSDKVLLRLMMKYPGTFYSIMTGHLTPENRAAFDDETGYPNYWYDPHTFYIVRLTTFICLLGMKSFLTTTILLAWFSFSGIWRLFVMFCEEFPHLEKQFAYAIFYIPSVAFWGSGLLKDTITLSAICWFSYSFYKAFIKRENFIKNFIYVFISMYLILSIKSYILYSLLPGTFLWLTYTNLGNINNKIIRYIVAPFLLFGGSISIFLLLKQLGNEMGKFNVNEILERAVITQQDLIKDYNGGNTFDIGKFDANIPSMLAKAPIAIVSGLFRPFIWEANNLVMLISSLENMAMLIFTILTLIKIRVFNFFGLLRTNPMLLFVFSFAICFAFSVGLSTPNFGSLVRYRIPSIPFFLISLILLRHFYVEKKENIKAVTELDIETRLANKKTFRLIK